MINLHLWRDHRSGFFETVNLTEKNKKSFPVMPKTHGSSHGLIEPEFRLPAKRTIDQAFKDSPNATSFLQKTRYELSSEPIDISNAKIKSSKFRETKSRYVVFKGKLLAKPSPWGVRWSPPPPIDWGS